MRGSGTYERLGDSAVSVERTQHQGVGRIGIGPRNPQPRDLRRDLAGVLGVEAIEHPCVGQRLTQRIEEVGLDAVLQAEEVSEVGQLLCRRDGWRERTGERDGVGIVGIELSHFGTVGIDAVSRGSGVVMLAFYAADQGKTEGHAMESVAQPGDWRG